jgi:predicted glycosyltransferase
MSLVWIDIDNPPQVQYLLPFKGELESRGHDVIVTARRHGITETLLQDRGVEYTLVGAESRGQARKAAAIVLRAQKLARTVHPRRPDIVLTTSRSGALAGALLRLPIFTIIDYEHVNLVVQRLARCRILFPEAIGAETFVRKGFARKRLIPFPGLKEGISFAGVDVEAVPPHDFGADARGLPVLLFRPPAELAHYYDAESSDLTAGALAAFAGRDDVQLAFSPRYPHQVDYLDRVTWRVPPIVLDRPVPFVALLRAVDAVMSSGGTMLREAAYLGVPAYSIFRSRIGAVDRYLVEQGALELVSEPGELERLPIGAAPPRPALPRGEDVLPRLVSEILGRA